MGGGLASDPTGNPFRANREVVKRVPEPLAESQGQNLALTVLYVPYSLDNGECQHSVLP